MMASSDQKKNGLKELKDLVQKLYDVDAIKFKEVILKSGQKSPVYIDLRVLVSYPQLMEDVAEFLWSKVSDQKFDLICGVPYTALPLATVISVRHKIPMVMRRKEAKNYGTNQMIEGSFQKGNRALIVEDVITSGTSVLETATSLEKCRIQVTDAVILLDRNQGGMKNLQDVGIKAHPVLDLEKVTRILMEEKKISAEERDTVLKWLDNNPSFLSDESLNEQNLLRQDSIHRSSFLERSQLTQDGSSLTSRLFRIMHEKKSNLCVALDMTSSDQVISTADQIGPYVCMIKLHVDIIRDFSFENLVIPLKELAKKHNFLIFEDRKFSDIGNTVKLQLSQGLSRLNEWVDVVTTHVLAGSGAVEGLIEASTERQVGCILVAQMSSKGNLLNQSFVHKAYLMAKQCPEFVLGFVCQNRLTSDPRFIHFMPGVSIGSKGDSLGQSYSTPDDAVKRGADVIIVGRGVTTASDVAAEAQKFQEICYSAYDNLTQNNTPNNH